LFHSDFEVKIPRFVYSVRVLYHAPDGEKVTE
jgi:hypothetical protein